MADVAGDTARNFRRLTKKTPWPHEMIAGGAFRVAINPCMCLARIGFSHVWARARVPALALQVSCRGCGPLVFGKVASCMWLHRRHSGMQISADVQSHAALVLKCFVCFVVSQNRLNFEIHVYVSQLTRKGK